MQHLPLGPLSLAKQGSLLPLQPFHHPFHVSCLHLCFLLVLKSFEKGSEGTKFQSQRNCTEKQTVDITDRTGGPVERFLTVDGSRVVVVGEMKMITLDG